MPALVGSYQNAEDLDAPVRSYSGVEGTFALFYTL